MELAVGAVLVLAGAVVQGCLGFGFGMVVVPVLLLMFPAVEVIPMTVLLSLIISLPMGLHARRYVHAGLLGPLVAGALVGFPVGMYVLRSFDGPGFKIGIGAFMVLLAAVMLSGWKRPMKNQHLALVPVGILSGILHGSISISGPPIILFLVNQETDKNRFRANILLYFSVIGTISTAIWIYMGAFTDVMWTRTGWYAGVVALGAIIGARLSQRVSQELFRRLTLMCAAVMGAVLVAQNVMKLL